MQIAITRNLFGKFHCKTLLSAGNQVACCSLKVSRITLRLFCFHVCSAKSLQNCNSARKTETGNSPLVSIPDVVPVVSYYYCRVQNNKFIGGCRKRAVPSARTVFEKGNSFYYEI